MKLAPVILFVYNRPFHTRQTIEALQQNLFADRSELFIFSDGPKNETDRHQVQEVRNYIKQIRRFKSVNIFEKEENHGLANSVISGVTSVINDYGRAIVLEDDLVTSPYFLKFMNEGLEFYKDEHEVFSISGYNHPPTLMKFPPDYSHDVYFNYRNSSWGWATWKDRWNKVDWDVQDFQEFLNDNQAQNDFNRGGDDLSPMLKAQMEGKIDSWAIRWCYSHFRNNAFAVHPVYSFVNNIGMDASGTHCGKTSRFINDLTRAKKNCEYILPVEANVDVQHSFRQVYKRTFLSKIKKKVRQIIGLN